MKRFRQLETTKRAGIESMEGPRVALLFLSRGPQPLEKTWAAWLAAAGQAVPRSFLFEQCSRGAPGLQALRTACLAALNTPTGFAVSTSNNFSNIIPSQGLFSVYIHAPPDFYDYPLGSLWGGHRINSSIETRWGDFSLTAATRALLSAAVSDPLNERFILLSESDIPLYDPLTFYMQLMSEKLSRVNACPLGDDRDMHRRWTPKMATEHMNSSHWRKSSQWFALQRRHAEILVEDSEVYDSFEKYCRYEMDQDLGRVRDCISDEHYIPTVFAVKGLEAEMDCGGWGIAAVDWSNGGAHPRSYTPQETTPETINSLRNSPNASKTQISAQMQFWTCSNVPKTVEECGKLAPPRPFDALPQGAMLTGRKFISQSAEAVLQLFHDCRNGLGLLLPLNTCDN